MQRVLVLFVLNFFVFGFVRAQNAKDLAKEIMDSYAVHKEPVASIKKCSEVKPEKLVDAFMPYSSGSNTEVRRNAIRMIHKFASRSNNSDLQSKVIRYFVELLDDKETSISGLALQYLQDYPTKAFDKETRYHLSERAKIKKFGQDRVILLTGYLGITELVYNYRKMLTENEVKDKRTRLYMQLAMARLGDTTAIGEIVALARKLPVTDDYVYDLCPDFAYTCQPQVYNILFDIILSDKKNCLSENPDNEKPIICAFRVIETIAPYLKNFPVPLDNQGDADITDYPATLAKVRTWINENKQKLEFNELMGI